MKYLNKLLPVLLLIILSWPGTGLAQQGDIDTNRMNRDINIMENILEEIFKIQTQSGGRGMVIADGGFFGSGREVKGTYLPGYGVIFTIPTGNTPLVYRFDEEGDRKAFSYSFVYRSDDNGDNKVDEETVTRRIIEFLRDYGSTIGQLDPEEHVLVIYGLDREDRELVFFDSEGKREESSFPVISVASKKMDLDAYRTGKLDDRQFDERIHLSKQELNEDRKLDLEVMANIFKTAFKERRDESSFRIRGSVNHLKLDNFGALFFFDVSYSSSIDNVFQFSFTPEAQVRGDTPQQRAKAAVLQELDKEIEEERKERTKRGKELEERTRSSFADFKAQLKEYMIDYGRTLRSVNSDQFVMASITVSSRVPDLPERMDIQVKKSVLEALDKGKIDREEALSQIRITEYQQ